MIYPVVVSFVLGIVFEKIFSFGWSAGLLIVLVSVIVFLFLHREDDSLETFFISPKIFLVIGAAFALGIFRMSFVNNSPDPDLLKLIGQKISFESVISAEPDVRDTSARYTVTVNQNSFSGYSQKCTDKILLNFSSCSPQSGSQGISDNTHSKNFDSRILLIADRYPELKYGDKISVSGRLDLPENFANDNGTMFDYVSYLSKDKIHFTMYKPQIEKNGEGSGNSPINSGQAIVSYLYSLKNIFIEKISAVVPEPNSSLLAGVIFGVKQSLGTELLDNFKKAGIIHIIVLSGYNITIIAVGIFYATSFLNRRELGFALSALFIVLFAVMVGLGATVIRAVIMSLIAILAKFLGRPSDALRWLFIAGLLMLLLNPLILFYDPSFQLSFMATLGLILFSTPIENNIAKARLSKFVPVKFKIREIISSTLAVQFFVLPLLIKMSGFVSVISFLINPLVLPLVPYAMGFGALTGAVGLIPVIGKIISWPFGIISYFITYVIISIAEISPKIPFATLNLGVIPFWLIFVWYSGYGFIFWKMKKPYSISSPEAFS
jgi:competence protein ComEC